MNCDRIARPYRWLEYAAFGRELERRRFRLLPDVADARNALVLGDGDGRFVARLAAQNKDTVITYIDSSHRMLELARSRAGAPAICYRLGDALTLTLPRAAYDLIATHFFLDCFNEQELALLVERVAAAAAPGAKWLISEFRQPKHGWRRVCGLALLQALYAFFGIFASLATRRLVDHRPLLRRRGFRLQREETAWFGLLISELWTLDNLV